MGGNEMKNSNGFFIGIVMFTLIVFGFMIFVEYMELIKFAWWWYVVVFSIPSISMFTCLFIEYVKFKINEKAMSK